jgi:hypothetical protein
MEEASVGHSLRIIPQDIHALEEQQAQEVFRPKEVNQRRCVSPNQEG